MSRGHLPASLRSRIDRAGRFPAKVGRHAAWARAYACLLGVAAVGAPAAAAERASPAETAVARSEIQAVLALALMTFDNKDFDRFAGMFAPEGRFTVDDPSGRVVVAPQNMAAAFSAREVNEPGAVRHILSGLYVTLTDKSHAKLRGYYMGVARSPSGPPTPADLGAFDSRLVKVRGAWMFEDYHVIHAGPVPLD